MARRAPAAGVAGLYPGPAAPGVRDEPPAPCRQRLVAARLRRADGAERRRRGADADHRARRPYRLGAQPRIPPRAADERQGPGDVRPVRRRPAGHRGDPDRPGAAGPGGGGARARRPRPAPVLRRAAGGPGGTAHRGAGRRVRQHHQAGLAPAAGRLAPGTRTEGRRRTRRPRRPPAVGGTARPGGRLHGGARVLRGIAAAARVSGSLAGLRAGHGRATPATTGRCDRCG